MGFSLMMIYHFSSGWIACFLANNNNIPLNNSNTSANPCAPPFGIKIRQITENTIHEKACKQYWIDDTNLVFFAKNVIPNKAILG